MLSSFLMQVNETNIHESAMPKLCLNKNKLLRHNINEDNIINLFIKLLCSRELIDCVIICYIVNLINLKIKLYVS